MRTSIEPGTIEETQQRLDDYVELKADEGAEYDEHELVELDHLFRRAHDLLPARRPAYRKVTPFSSRRFQYCAESTERYRFRRLRLKTRFSRRVASTIHWRRRRLLAASRDGRRDERPLDDDLHVHQPVPDDGGRERQRADGAGRAGPVDPVDLARQIDRLLGNPDLRATLARNASQEVVPKHEWATVAAAAEAGEMNRMTARNAFNSMSVYLEASVQSSSIDTPPPLP